MRTPIIIDTDPGIDDVIAITAAAFSEKLEVGLITTVAGNVDINRTTKNAIDLIDFLEKDIPVVRGMANPLLKPLVTASYVHGDSGIGGYSFESDGSHLLNKNENAVIEMRKYILNSSEPVTLVPIGPLTNIATLLRLFPEVKENIKKIVLMGGASEGGNYTPVAEFNIFVDPHAAKIVFDEEIDIVMCGLDVTRATSVNFEEIKEIKSYGKVGKMISEMLMHYSAHYSKKELIIHDLCTIFYLTNPEMFTVKNAKVDVVTNGAAEGCTITHFTEKGNVKVCLNADRKMFTDQFIKVFKNIDEKGMS